MGFRERVARSVALFKHGQERFLGNVDRPHILHALLAFFLLFQQLAFPRDVAAVALGGHVLPHGFDGFTGNDLPTDGRLQRDFELMSIDLFLELAQDGPGAVFRAFAVANQAEGFDLFAVHQDLHLDADITEIQAGDRFLVCTDGLYKELTLEKIQSMLGVPFGEQILTALFDEALQRGGRDNITGIVVDVR